VRGSIDLMSGEDVEREVARRVASYQSALSKARAEVERERERSNALQRELEHARRGGGYGAHHCPEQEQVQAAMRSRHDAFRALGRGGGAAQAT
jgi:multidrug resistance efflux pump